MVKVDFKKIFERVGEITSLHTEIETELYWVLHVFLGMEDIKLSGVIMSSQRQLGDKLKLCDNVAKHLLKGSPVLAKWKDIKKEADDLNGLRGQVAHYTAVMNVYEKEDKTWTAVRLATHPHNPLKAGGEIRREFKLGELNGIIVRYKELHEDIKLFENEAGEWLKEKARKRRTG